MWSHKSILPALRFWPNAQASDLLAATGCSLSVTTSESNENNNGSVSMLHWKSSKEKELRAFLGGEKVFLLFSQLVSVEKSLIYQQA